VPDPQPVPDWVTPILGPGSPCLICGVPRADQRHRILDTMAERIQAGEPRGSVADDYEVPLWFVDRVAAEWPVPEAGEE
jgi:hypothetical protein